MNSVRLRTVFFRQRSLSTTARVGFAVQLGNAATIKECALEHSSNRWSADFALWMSQGDNKDP